MRISPASGRLGAGEHAEQRGLAGTVRPDDADDAAARQREIQVIDQQAIAESLAQALDLDDQVAQPRSGRDVDLVGLVALLELLGGELIVAGQARFALGLTCLRIGAHPLEFARECFAQCVALAFLERQPLFLLFEPGGIVALPGNSMAAIELEDPLGDVIEEVPVVGHGDHGARIFLEVALEPRYRLGIQMIGGLIEQQHVRLRQQQPAQRHATLLTTRKLRDIGVPRRQAQRVGSDLELAAELPAVRGVDRVLQFRLFFEQLVHLLVLHRLGEQFADVIEALEQCEGATDAFHDHAAHILVRIELRFLRQKSDLDPGLRPGLAIDVLVDAGHDPQQCGFAGTVQAEHADLGAGEKRQTDVAQDGALGRHHLRDSIHRVNVLRHGAPVQRRRRARIIDERLGAVLARCDILPRSAVSQAQSSKRSA